MDMMPPGMLSSSSRWIGDWVLRDHNGRGVWPFLQPWRNGSPSSEREPAPCPQGGWGMGPHPILTFTCRGDPGSVSLSLGICDGAFVTKLSWGVNEESCPLYMGRGQTSVPSKCWGKAVGAVWAWSWGRHYEKSFLTLSPTEITCTKGKGANNSLTCADLKNLR